MRKEKKYDMDRLKSIKKLIELGKGNACAEIIRYIEDYPSDKDGYYVYGKLAMANKDYELAKEMLSIASEVEHGTRYAALKALGDIARKEGNIELAKQYFRQSIKESPSIDEYSQFSLVRLERENGNYTGALETLATFGELSTRLQLEKARVLCLSGKIEEADSLISTVIPENVLQEREFAYIKAIIFGETGNHEMAKYYYSKARGYGSKDDEYYRILNNEARFHLSLGEYQEAYDCVNESYNNGYFEFGNTNLILGKAKFGLKDYYNAHRHFKIASEKSTKQFGTTYSTSEMYLGYLKILAGDNKGAEEHLKESIEFGNKSEGNYFLLLVCYVRQKKYQEAEQIIKEIRKMPELESLEEMLRLAEIFIEKETGKQFIESGYDKRRYRSRQILNYDPGAAIRHIVTEHTARSDKSCFSRKINIDKLFSEIPIHFVPENRVIDDFFDKYIIEYPDAGYSSDGEKLDKICVITIPNTKEILTMYPCTAATDHLQQEVAKALSTESVNSRIAGFQKRFGRFVQPVKK